MTADRLRFAARLHTSVPIDQVPGELRRLPLGSRPRTEQPDASTLQVATGSRLRYQLLGAWAGGEHLPALLEFKMASQDQCTAVKLTMTSDQGWYATQTPLALRAYSARWDELLAVLAEAGFVLGHG